MRVCEPARGVGERVDARQRADGDVDVVVDQLVERHIHAVVHPCQNAAAVRADAEFAQQQRLMRLRGAQPGRAARERRQRGRQQTVPVASALTTPITAVPECGPPTTSTKWAMLSLNVARSTIACAGYRRRAAR